MKFFLDTADIEQVKSLMPLGIIDGITTNPSLIAKSNQKIEDVIAQMCDLISGPVSAEVTATDYEGMIQEGRHLSKIASNVAVKVPLTFDGLRVCYELSQEDIMVNVTLCFSAAQALIAAKAGASFISPFIGRLDDIGQDGLNLIQEICEIYGNYPDIETEILAASTRHPLHIIEAAKMGADIATIPPSLVHQMLKHPLTNSGLEAFIQDWNKTGQKIL